MKKEIYIFFSDLRENILRYQINKSFAFAIFKVDVRKDWFRDRLSAAFLSRVVLKLVAFDLFVEVLLL